jgi:HK97 family phage major capsid protein
MSGTATDPAAPEIPEVREVLNLAEATTDELVQHARSGDYRIVREPLTYRSPQEGGEHSYFHDRFMAKRGHQECEERLKRHEVEWRTNMKERELRAMLAVDAPFEVRVTPNWEPGQGGFFAPPLWMIKYYADIPRPERVLARLAPNFLLPKGPQEINFPVLTGKGPSAGPQSPDRPPSDTDIADNAAKNGVVTIAGTEDVPLPMLEQSPASASLDWLIGKALEAAYQEQLEFQLVNGNGVGQILGLLNVKGINPVEYAGPAEGTTLYPVLGKALAAIGRKRKIPPEAWLMNTPRFAWIATSEDKQERPLLLSDYDGDFPTASLASRPVYLDDGMPTLANGQEPIIACCPSDLMVLESDPIIDVMPQPLAGTMGVRIQTRRYVVGVTGRYPTGISAITGAGMVPAAGF